jgi:hypothetical protein
MELEYLEKKREEHINELTKEFNELQIKANKMKLKIGSIIKIKKPIPTFDFDLKNMTFTNLLFEISGIVTIIDLHDVYYEEKSFIKIVEVLQNNKKYCFFKAALIKPSAGITRNFTFCRYYS